MNNFVTELRKQHAEFMTKQKRQARVKRQQKQMAETNELYWTDGPKYAEKYYGDVYRQTTRYDNDWD